MNPVKQLREARGLTQQQLAASAGLRQQYVSDLETGRIKNPSLRAANKLARVLKVDPAALLAESQPLEAAAHNAA